MSTPALESTAVVTVSYNSGRHLRAFLSSVRAMSQRVPVIVADNGSTDLDGTREICREYDATLLELSTNHGYGGAVNRAIGSLPDSVDSVLVSNPDVRVTADALPTLVATLAAHEDAGAVGPRVLNEDGSIYPSARRLPSLRTGIGHALFGRIWRRNPWTARYLSDVSETPVLRQAGWLSGSCLLVRRSAFDAINGFDDAFFMYFEDVDLGYRLAKAGWSSFYEPDAVVTHTGAHSTTSDSTRMVVAHHTSAYTYLSRKYSAWYLAPVRWTLRIGLSARSRWLTRR